MNIPEGWQLVPIEPTPEMLDALENADIHPYRTPVGWTLTQEAYSVMLAAAPTPPAPEVEPVAWLIEYDCVGVHRISLQGHNAIADYRDIDPEAKSTPLYPHPANDGLRKAAEELLAYLDRDYTVYQSHELAKNLRAELNKK